MVKYALKIFGKNLQLMLDISNIITNEKIYCIKVSCNDIIFSVCINKNDLIGEPMVGRRFKGNIWMQGSICL